MRNRSREEMRYQILKTCEHEPHLKTYILYRTFTTHKETVGHINELIGYGLLTKVGSSISEQYITTDKGLKYMTLIGKQLDMLGFSTDIDQRMSQVR